MLEATPFAFEMPRRHIEIFDREAGAIESAIILRDEVRDRPGAIGFEQFDEAAAGLHRRSLRAQNGKIVSAQQLSAKHFRDDALGGRAITHRDLHSVNALQHRESFLYWSCGSEPGGSITGEP